MLPLISVIIPIYKVEAYLRQCIESILVQTYQNLEIILVDDGSPDYCPEICDEYAEKDDRVHVIHKENGGLSDARNAGLTYASGEYISFIDSDDWILPDMLEYLYKGIVAYEADITVCGYYDCYGKKMSTTYRRDTQIYKGDDAVEALLFLKFPNFSWNKLYKKELWSRDVCFPKGKVYEDVRTIYKLIEPDTIIAVLPEAKYCYRKRSDSITGTPSLKNKIESVESRITRFLDIAEKYPNVQNFMLKDICKYLPGLRNAVCKNTQMEYQKWQNELYEISMFLQLHIERIVKAYHLGRLGKLSYRYMAQGTRRGWFSSRMVAGVIKYHQKIHRVFQFKKYKSWRKKIENIMPFSNVNLFIKCIYRSSKDFLQNGWKRRNARYAHFYNSTPIVDKVVLYESFWGRGMLCGPYALFLQMINDPQYADFEHIWVLDDPNEYTESLGHFQSFSNVRFVKYMSKEYLKALCEAKYLVNNAAFPSFYTKRDGQIYIHTWHGIPLKKLGFDLSDGIKQTHNAIRNFLQVDYLISANPFLTEIYRHTYKLDGIFKGSIIEEGYPRLDTLIRYDKATLLQRLKGHGLDINENKKIILYAPTWREIDKNPAVVLERYEHIKKIIEEECPEYQVLIKAHQYVYKLIKKTAEASYIIPSTIDANEVLPIADILIGDYSSIYFDYLYFQRPILFYIPDLQDYLEYRGLYFPVENLPGPYSENLEDILKWLHSIDDVHEQYREKLKSAQKWSCTEHAGGISRKILDIALQKKHDGYHIIEGLFDSKKKLLIYRGRMKANWISSLFLRFINEIDTDKFDVSVVVLEGKTADEISLIESISPNVRVLMRRSTFNLSFFSDICQRLFASFGLNGIGHKVCPYADYQNELRRSFGHAEFDISIDFDGSDLNYAMMAAQIPNAKHGLLQHYNLTGKERKKKPMMPSIYPMFDYIFTLKKEVLTGILDQFSTGEKQEKFVYVNDPMQILEVFDIDSEI